MDRIEKAPRRIEIRKAGGDDNMEPEMVKWMSEEEKRWLHIIY